MRIAILRLLRLSLTSLALLLSGSGLLMANHPVPLPPHVSLELDLDPQQRTLSGRAEWQLHGSHSSLLLSDQFDVETLLVDGQAITTPPTRRSGLQHWQLPGAAGPHHIEVHWRGELAAVPHALQHEDTLSFNRATLGLEGGFLPAVSMWYPRIHDEAGFALHSWEVRLHLPTGQRGILPGELKHEEEGPDGYRAHFVFTHPGEGIDLMTGPYVIAEHSISSVDGRTLKLRTYFHDEVADLAQTYLAAAGEQLAYHESRLGPYPFERFSVVSSPTPTGFGMPTLTYLGVQVLRLPFIRNTSLGHEILHNWWGNGVYPDYASGNWSEGLTTYLADYTRLAQQDEDEARQMRVNWLRELSAISPANDRPLASFTSRQHSAGQAIGYGKAAALFAMLEARIGTTAFNAGLRNFWHDHRFQTASWHDLQRAFEHTHGDSLETFFAQWLQRPGLPVVQLQKAKLGDDQARTTVHVRLRQNEPVYELDVPLVIVDAQGQQHPHVVRLEGRVQEFMLPAPPDAQEVWLDPDSRLLRRLAPAEAPPILREIQLDDSTRLQVLQEPKATSAGQAFREAAQQWQARWLRSSPEPRPSNAGPHAELLIGSTSAVDAWLAQHGLQRPAEVQATPGDVQLWAQRQPNGKVRVIVSADNAEALAQALRPAPHYGRNSWLVIREGSLQARGTWPTQPAKVAIQR